VQLTTYYQPRIGGFSDYHVLMNPAAVFTVTGVLHARIEAQVRYGSRPPEQVEPLDYTIRNALEAAF
jgi:hypothetical protein